MIRCGQAVARPEDTCSWAPLTGVDVLPTPSTLDELAASDERIGERRDTPASTIARLNRMRYQEGRHVSPIIGLGNVDVWGFVDSDTDEARTFRTYLGYWNALDDLIVETYGDAPIARIHRALQGDRSFQRLAIRRFSGDVATLRARLVNSWAHEQQLYVIDHDNPDLLRVVNHGAPVPAYYSVAQCLCAWSVVRTNTEPNGHRAVLRGIAQQVNASPGRYPPPWNLRCTGVEGERRYDGFRTGPQPCSNLSIDAPPLDRVAQCLHTTRRRTLERSLDEAKRRERRQRARRGERSRIDADLLATTVFDFLLRARTRSSYGDPGMYYMGQLGDADVVRFARSVRRVTAATAFLLLALITQWAPEVVADAASHFISRDRSRITEEMLVPRLVQLGMATPPTRARRAS